MNIFCLKMIAIVSMLIDHIGYLFMNGTPYYLFFRGVGRLAFPIICFVLVEGFLHTHNIKLYFVRIAIAALISEIPFDLCIGNGTLFDINKQNVLITLLIALAVIYLTRSFKDSVPIGICICSTGMLLAYFIKSDYDAMGVLIVYIIYVCREHSYIRGICVAVANVLMTGIQCLGAAAVIPISLYNGQKGKSCKYLFYAIYPVHMCILFLITKIV